MPLRVRRWLRPALLEAVGHWSQYRRRGRAPGFGAAQGVPLVPAPPAPGLLDGVGPGFATIAAPPLPERGLTLTRVDRRPWGGSWADWTATWIDLQGGLIPNEGGNFYFPTGDDFELRFYSSNAAGQSAPGQSLRVTVPPV